MKTNAARLLDQRRIPYRMQEYEVDVDDLSAPAVAAKIGMNPAQVFKTLVCRVASGAHCFAVVPGDRELDLKVLARALGERSADTVALKDVQPLTGYIRGGVTVLGAKKAFAAVLDQSAFDFQEIAVSAGIRGTQLLLAAADYVRATGAKVVSDLGRPSMSD
jgi:Cys-tRNA(Pro)/Cys-tRNA(Cys) deacylase